MTRLAAQPTNIESPKRGVQLYKPPTRDYNAGFCLASPPEFNSALSARLEPGRSGGFYPQGVVHASLRNHFADPPDQSEQVPAMLERYKGMTTAGGGQIHRVKTGAAVNWLT